MTRTLVVMARTPRIGHGKSRIARDAGAVEAWRINRALHRRTFAAAIDRRWRTVLAVTPDRDRALCLPGVWPGASRVAQGGGDLGARLARALMGVRGPVAVIGTDCPALRRSDIARAFAAALRRGVAVGPAVDGGFWILAARRARDVLGALAPVRWSSAHTLADLERNLGRPAARLRTLRDVDTLADWRAVQRAP
jgi:glycosyltransferase A (GT-A) superfamily protein (DUF2064 family)